MVDTALRLPEVTHPKKEMLKDYNMLVGIDEQKKELLRTLEMLLDHQKIQEWEKKFHKKGLPILSHIKNESPLIILSGEVGCGKTALALSVGTPLAELLNRPVKVFETPSNIRGSGLVGEISHRITAVFETALARLQNKEVGILIIDEADDIATSRAQNQAHHEDRAGLNVLIKQIDSIKKSNKALAVIMITNRVIVLDPAIRRRTSLHLVFERPTGKKLDEILTLMLEGIEYSKSEMDMFIKACSAHRIPYSYSDLFQRLVKQTTYEAVERNVPLSISIFREVLQKIEPTPMLEESKLN